MGHLPQLAHQLIYQDITRALLHHTTLAHPKLRDPIRLSGDHPHALVTCSSFQPTDLLRMDKPSLPCRPKQVIQASYLFRNQNTALNCLPLVPSYSIVVENFMATIILLLKTQYAQIVYGAHKKHTINISLEHFHILITFLQ